MTKAKLILEDGYEFEGKSFGANNSTAGEVVFNTGMVGYPEALTDPSYSGQILTLTYPLIGNYGVPKSEIALSLSSRAPKGRGDLSLIDPNFESSKIHVKALIVSDYSFEYSHYLAKQSLSSWLLQNKIPGIYGIDTRALTKKLREKGVMLGKIVVEGTQDIALDFYDPNCENLVAKVSRKRVEYYGKGALKIVVVDCGCKNNILRCLLNRNVKIIVVPWSYDFNKIGYDGLLISNGPGDPKMCVATIKNVRTALKNKKPIMGICLGNQILALAAGGDTYKLPYGHRGQNQPCLKVGTKRCFITSQNHGFAVDYKKLPKDWESSFVNVNDNTNEGIRHKSGLYFSVQFHPEAKVGPVDTEFLFDDFINLIIKRKLSF